MTYPDRRAPDVATPVTPLHRLQEFAIAVALGYLTKEWRRLTDPDAPAGLTFLPIYDPGVRTILHQFAIALLGLPRDCPDTWTCACNSLRARYNALPPDHPQTTDALSLAALNDLNDLRRALHDRPHQPNRPHQSRQPHRPDRPDRPAKQKP